MIANGTEIEIELRDEADLTPKQKADCRLIRRNVRRMHRLLDEIAAALDAQERHVVSEAIDHTRNFAFRCLLRDAIEFAQSDDAPEDHLDDDTFGEWEDAGSPEDVAAWLAERNAMPAAIA